MAKSALRLTNYYSLVKDQPLSASLPLCLSAFPSLPHLILIRHSNFVIPASVGPPPPPPAFPPRHSSAPRHTPASRAIPRPLLLAALSDKLPAPSKSPAATTAICQSARPRC